VGEDGPRKEFRRELDYGNCFRPCCKVTCNMDEADRRRNAAVSNGFGKWLGIGCWAELLFTKVFLDSFPAALLGCYRI
jgi:hypothetical protein